MIRVLFFVLLLFAFALGLAWLAARPGDVAITWLGYEAHASVTVAVVALLALFAAIAAVWTILRWIFTSPRIVGGYFSARRRDRGYGALSRGMIAVGAGDAKLAAKNAADAARLLSDEPLTLLLTAQTAQLRRDLPAARSAFESMLRKPETRLLGLHGLYVEARRQGEHEAARQYAEEALRDELGIAWAGSALFEYQAAAGEWHAATRTLASNRRAKLIDGEMATRLQAVLETAEAMTLEAGRPEEAKVLALAAHRRAPSLVPAAVLAARLSSRLGDVRRAARIIERSWRVEPHPDLAEAYKTIRPGDSVRDRLRRMQRLTEIRANHREGRLALAEAAIEARSWEEAREALGADMAAPSERVCLLLADIAEGEGDTGLARDWLARAGRAPRDAAWIADGVVFDAWAPISPISGRLDAFEWKVPEPAGRLVLSGARQVDRLRLGAEPAPVPLGGTLGDTEHAILTELDLAALAPPPSRPIDRSGGETGAAGSSGLISQTAPGVGGGLTTASERFRGPGKTIEAVSPPRPPDDPGPERAGDTPPLPGRFGL